MASKVWHYVIGDIHGCRDQLLALEEKIHLHAARHEAEPFIVSVGDLVDRGPASAAVVRHFRTGVAAGTHAVVAGNHEQEMLRVLVVEAPWCVEACGPPRHLGPSLADAHAAGTGKARWLSWREYRDYHRLNWLSQGGATALASWGVDAHDSATWALPPEDVAFLAGLPVLWENGTVAVTHALATRADLATLRSGAGHAAAWSTAAWSHAVRQALWNRKYPPEAPDPSRTHVSGHTPGDRVRRSPRLGTMRIDTGCVYGGRLTAWCAEAERLLAVAGLGMSER